MTHTDLLRQALDALELQEPAVGCPREREHWKRTAMPTIAALRAALAAPVEPVRELLIQAAALAVVAERQGKYPGAAQVADEVLKAQPAIDGFGGNLDEMFDAPAVPLTDEQIKQAVTAAVKSGACPWMGYEKDDDGRYTLPVLSAMHYGIARAVLAAPAVPADMVMVPLSFVQGFNTLAHNWSLRAEPPSFYTGTEGDAFTRAYAECGQALAKLRAMIASAPAVPAVDCRSCARCYATKGRGVYGCDSVVRCTNGDRYQPLPPVKLWRAA